MEPTSTGENDSTNFSVANAESLFGNGSDFAFNDLVGPGDNFDWGLPYLFGRTVFTAIEGKKTPGGVGPYWAF